MNSRSIKSPRVYQYSLRLDANHRDKLIDIATYQHKPKSRVLDDAIDKQWNIYQAQRNLGSLLPKLNTQKKRNQWVLDHYGHRSEVVAKLTSAAAIFEYTKQLSRNEVINQEILNELDTIAFLLKVDGVNINQLTRQANSGVPIDLNKLKPFTQNLIDLKNSVEDLKKKV